MNIKYFIGAVVSGVLFIGVMAVAATADSGSGSNKGYLVLDIAIALVLCVGVLCLYRAFATKACVNCRRDVPRRARVCPGCHSVLDAQMGTDARF